MCCSHYRKEANYNNIKYNNKDKGIVHDLVNDHALYIVGDIENVLYQGRRSLSVV